MGYEGFIHPFLDFVTMALTAIVGLLVLLGLANAVVVLWRTVRMALAQGGLADEKPQGLIGMKPYLNMLADILLVVIGIELIETFISFLNRESPKAYLAGVIGAALVALARRVIVFFDPDAAQPLVTEMFAYAALLAALAGAYAVIQVWG